jgi:hypothetical protein
MKSSKSSLSPHKVHNRRRHTRPRTQEWDEERESFWQYLIFVWRLASPSLHKCSGGFCESVLDVISAYRIVYARWNPFRSKYRRAGRRSVTRGDLWSLTLHIFWHIRSLNIKMVVVLMFTSMKNETWTKIAEKIARILQYELFRAGFFKSIY